MQFAYFLHTVLQVFIFRKIKVKNAILSYFCSIDFIVILPSSFVVNGWFFFVLRRKSELNILFHFVILRKFHVHRCLFRTPFPHIVLLCFAIFFSVLFGLNFVTGNYPFVKLGIKICSAFLFIFFKWGLIFLNIYATKDVNKTSSISFLEDSLLSTALCNSIKKKIRECST